MSRRKNGDAATAPVRQQRIPGTYEPVPKPVQRAADDYVSAKREMVAWREKMNGRRDTLIDRMHEHSVTEMDIDDGEKKIVLADVAQVKIKAKKAPKDLDGAPSSENGDGDDETEPEGNDAGDELETRVIQMSNCGKSQQAIANELGITRKRVRTILAKVNT